MNRVLTFNTIVKNWGNYNKSLGLRNEVNEQQGVFKKGSQPLPIFVNLGL